MVDTFGNYKNDCIFTSELKTTTFKNRNYEK